MLRGLALLTRLGQGTLVGPARLAPWAESLGVSLVSPPEPIDKPSLERFFAGLDPPDLLIVDVFPRGLLGELEGLRSRARASWLVTRIVKPAYYRHPPVREALATFERVIWTEDPPAGLLTAQGPGSLESRLAPLLLAPALPPRAEARARLGLGASERVILALGAGPHDGQVRLHRLLVRLSAELAARLMFVSDELPDEPSVVRAFPAAPLLPAADVVVSAGGYHSFHELRAAAVPAVFLPQQRRYDDQHLRVRGCLVAEDPASLEKALGAALEGDPPPQAFPPRLEHPEAGVEALAELVRERLERRRSAST
ncbi:MAG TPA: hypothetical protein VI589_13635 [Vicinamibacteria bacterium]